MQRPRAQRNNKQQQQQQQQNQMKAGWCSCETSELSGGRVQEGEGMKTKPACSPQANIVYIAVHANSMNIL